MRLAILGGGGFRVPLVVREVRRRPALGIDDLVLYDIDARRLAVVAATVGAGSPAVRTTTSLVDAVRGADIVFCAIRVGGADGRVRDERRARARGVLGQETVGAGGIAYGLRTLPVVLHIAAVIAELAPAAWTINFTNPAGMITEAMQTVLGDRVIGICDSPSGLVRHACAAIGVGAAAAVPAYAGVNHLGWLRGLVVEGHDALPRLLAAPELLGSFEEGRLFGPELLRSLGALPNEYLYFYYRTDEVFAAMRDQPTRGEVVRAQQDAFYAAPPGQESMRWRKARTERERTYLAEARTADRDDVDLQGGGYERVALDLMRALLGGDAADLILNVRNGVVLPQLPPETVIEVPCRVDADGPTADPMPPLTLHQLGLVSSVRGAERAAIDAVLGRSQDAALRAFATHPLVASWRLGALLLQDLLADDAAVARLLASP